MVVRFELVTRKSCMPILSMRFGSAALVAAIVAGLAAGAGVLANALAGRQQANSAEAAIKHYDPLP